MQIMDQFGAAPGAESVRMPDGTERTLAAEHAAAILVNEQPAFRVVCTPELLPQLALGRLLTEGWITLPLTRWSGWQSARRASR